jgi:hypothetical protein
MAVNIISSKWGLGNENNGIYVAPVVNRRSFMDGPRCGIYLAI